MIIVFDKEEQGKEYINWCAANQEQFVLNTGRKKNSNLFSLHIGKCTHISDTLKLKEQSYIHSLKIKVCSNSIEELKKWVRVNRENFVGQFRECKRCTPNRIIN